MKFSAVTFRQAYVEYSFTTIYLLFTMIIYFSVNFLPSLKSQTDSVLSLEVAFFLNLFFKRGGVREKKESIGTKTWKTYQEKIKDKVLFPQTVYNLEVLSSTFDLVFSNL